MNRLAKRDLKQIESEVRAICSRVGCLGCDVNDVIQDTFVALMEEDITVNAACARALRLRKPPRPGPHPDRLADPAPSPDEIVQDREETARLMARLTPVEREIVRLLQAGHTQVEVSQALGISVRKVGMQMQRLGRYLHGLPRRERK